MRGSNSLGRGTGQRCCSKTWDEEFKIVWEGERVKDVVQRLGMKGSNSLGRRTVQPVGKENRSKILFKDLG